MKAMRRLLALLLCLCALTALGTTLPADGTPEEQPTQPEPEEDTTEEDGSPAQTEPGTEERNDD